MKLEAAMQYRDTAFLSPPRKRRLFPVKRVGDIVIAGLGLAALSVPFLVLGLLIYVGDGGAPFYRGRRVGLAGHPFSILKFRTMRPDAERSGVSSTAEGDPRVTRVGAWLRKYKLDELPQLWNVLRGDMSLVGPRPEVQRFVDLYTEEERVILSVRPGMTDWASLWNIDEGAVLQGSADPDRTYCELIRPTKIQLQLAYVRRGTLWTDVRIVFHTLRAIVFKVRLPEQRIVEMA